MKNKLLLCILALVFFVSVSAVPQAKPQTWEYKIEQKCFDEKRINQLGDEGWELAGYNEGDHGGWHCIFKRPK